MIFRYTQKNLTWIDLERPTHEEVKQVITEWNIHPIVGQELIGPTLRPKVEIYPNFIYLILHFPVTERKRNGRPVAQREIDFIIGKNFIITTRYDAVDSLHRFAKLFEVNSILDRNDIGEHAGFVFYYMIREIYDSLLHEMEYINDSIRTIEGNIFKGKERAMVMRISEVSRDLLDAKRSMRLHKEILESFDIAARKFFGEEFSYYSKAIIGEYYKVHNALESDMDSISELRQTNNSLLDTRENEIMKRITIIAFLTLPASVITNFFQMSTAHTPIVGQPNDWLILMTIMFGLTVFLFVVAKSRRWF
jgi:magnesium transporter